MPILPLSIVPELVANEGIRMAVLAVPAVAAQAVADAVVAAGIVGILNFAPVTLSLPKQVQIVGVDLAIQLEQLAFSVVHGQVISGEDDANTEESPPLVE